MYGHLPLGITEKRPQIVMFLGLAMFVFSVGGWRLLYVEYRGFGSTPVVVDLRTVVPPAEFHGKWIRVTQPLMLHCDTSIQQTNGGMESLFLGRVEATYYLATLEDSDRFVVVKHKGKITCAGIAKLEKVGVLEELSSLRRDAFYGANRPLPASGLGMEFCLSCGPRQAKQFLMLFSFLPVFSVVAILYFGAKYKKVREQQARA